MTSGAVMEDFQVRNQLGFARLSFFLLSGILLLSTFWASRSHHFLLKTIEVRNLPAHSPVSAEELIALSGVQVGQESLLYLPLGRMSARIHEEPWIKAVHLEKVPPASLVLEVDLKSPIAVFQGPQGSLRWVDEKGELFGMVDPSRTGHQDALDLPMISGIHPEQDALQLADAASFLVAWKRELQMDGALRVELSSLSYHEQKGWRGWLSYHLAPKSNSPSTRARLSIDLGDSLAVSEGDVSRLGRIRSVLSYIRERGISARHLFADSDKKIVVKLASGS